MKSEDRFWAVLWMCLLLIVVTIAGCHSYETHEYVKAGLCKSERHDVNDAPIWERCK